MSMVLSLVVALFLGVLTFKSYISQQRGTNAFTRFVRDSMNHSRQKQYLMLSFFAGILFTVTSLAGENQWWSGIPCFIVAGVNMVLMVISNKNKQRVKDARTTTKGSLQVAGQVSETAGATVAVAATAIATQGTATPGMYKSAAMVGKTAGAGLGEIATKCADTMTDVDVPDFDMSKVNEMMSSEEFLECAANIGIPTEGRTMIEVGQDVYKYVPAFYKDRHLEESPEVIACKFLQGVS